METYRREDTAIAEKMGQLVPVSTRANVALALSIILLVAQVIKAIFKFKAWLNKRASRRSADPERGLELGNISRSMPADTVPVENKAPRQPPRLHLAIPVGSSPMEAHGRPVAAYERGEVHGENDDYYNPSPISRRPTWTADSGLGPQTQGADYKKQRREKRYEDGHNTNRNNANYGRKGNKFAHGT